MSVALPIYFDTKYKASLTAKPRTLVRANYIHKRVTTLMLPAFEVNTVWRGASEIVKEFLYVLDNRISFIKVTKPANVRFVACIAWKPTSETIVRYKLWDHDDDILYVPLYNGERIESTFSIEIWNVKPAEGSGGTETIVSEEDEAIFVTEEGEEIITAEGDDLVGTEEVLTFDGVALMHLSKLLIPTDKCNLANDELLPTQECVDVTFNLFAFNPYRGDYYTVDDDCGTTTLHEGTVVALDYITLQSTDLTWHRVYVMRYEEVTHLVVDQDNTDESDTPYVYVVESPGDHIKLDLMYYDGVHHLRVDQDPTTVENFYNVIYFLATEDGSYYGVKAKYDGASYYVEIAQESTDL
jgi:hypothetical protein